jgi:hypothetical protein
MLIPDYEPPYEGDERVYYFDTDGHLKDKVLTAND